MGLQKYFVVAATGSHAAIDLAAMNDPELSWKAKALHYYIRTRGEVTTNQEALVAAGPEGRDAVNNGVKELIQRKYLYLTQIREAGRFKYAAYISLPKPVILTAEQLHTLMNGEELTPPHTAFPDTGNPLHGAEYGRLLVTNTRKPELSNAKALPNSLSFLGDKRVATRIEDIFKHWNAQPSLPTHRRGHQYKTYQISMKHIHQILQKHDPMFIKDAITNYNALLEDGYTVLRGKEAPDRVGLYEFFKWAPYTLTLIEKHKPHLHGVKSWFTECRQGMTYLKDKYGTLRKNKHPATTASITDALREAGIIGDTPITRDRNTIRIAAERVTEFHNNNRDLLPQRMVAPALGRELVNSIEGAKHAGYLTSDITWGNFENYLAEQGIMDRRTNVRRERAATGAGI